MERSDTFWWQFQVQVETELPNVYVFFCFIKNGTLPLFFYYRGNVVPCKRKGRIRRSSSEGRRAEWLLLRAQVYMSSASVLHSDYFYRL